jgi:4-hydroxyphenylpyruvate dioxygenase-like putative hemolysin
MEMGVFPINEPAEGKKIEEYLDFYGGPIQHIAIATDDII